MQRNWDQRQKVILLLYNENARVKKTQKKYFNQCTIIASKYTRYTKTYYYMVKYKIEDKYVHNEITIFCETLDEAKEKLIDWVRIKIIDELHEMRKYGLRRIYKFKYPW